MVVVSSDHYQPLSGENDFSGKKVFCLLHSEEVVLERWQKS